MDDFFSKVQKQLEMQLPFVIYCKPDSHHLVGFLQKTDTLFEVSNFSEKGFTVCSFDRKQNILLPENESEVIKVPLENIDFAPNDNAIKSIDLKAKEDFMLLVGKAVQAIQDKSLNKVVLSRVEQVSIENFDFVKTFIKLASAYRSAFRYCFYHPKIGMWLGASPEQLLKITESKFKTTALAGTQPYNEINDATWESKEKEEQQFVTDFIMENLESVASDIAISNPYTYRAGNLVHIKTDIEGSLDTASNLKNVLEILHPTPAVCGLPREAATKFIIQNEGYDRSFYSGFLGELNIENRTDLFVNIRCMEIKGSNAHLYIGCGITKDSDPEKEFDETVNKAMTMKKILN